MTARHSRCADNLQLVSDEATCDGAECGDAEYRIRIDRHYALSEQVLARPTAHSVVMSSRAPSAPGEKRKRDDEDDNNDNPSGVKAHTLFVGNLDPRTNEYQLMQLFKCVDAR